MGLSNGTVFAEASGPTCSAKKKISVMALKTATLFARKTEYHGLVIETRLQKTKYPNKSRNTSMNSHSKKQLEIPPRIPIPKSNVKYLHSKMLQREIPPGIPIPKNNVKYLHSKMFHIVPKWPLKR